MAATILLGNHIYDDTAVERAVVDGDYDLVTASATTTDDLVAVDAEDVVALVNPPYPTTAAAFEAFPDLRVLAVTGIGVDHVDLDAASAHGVQVVNVPDYCVEEVSTHAVSLLLAVARQLGAYDRDVRDGGWDWRVGQPIHRLAGRTLGLVGFGDIPRRVAEKLSGFDLEVLAYDPYVDDAVLAEYGVERADFETLLHRADLVSVHAPLTDETEGLFDAAAFARMQETAVLVNAARGPIVEERALAAAVAEGEIAGAGVDVFAEEPPGDTPLADLDRVILTPHAAWYSEEAAREVREQATADVVRVLEGDEPENPVNDPA
ncbi:C-terminal binding protein [Halobacteriales archaeon Cl-PHB]